MTKYEKIAEIAIRRHLNEANGIPVTLFHISCVADEVVKKAGKKRELYTSLYDYESLLPGDYTCKWLGRADPGSDSILYVVPRSWKSGDSKSNSLLIGAGDLVEKSSPDF